MPKANAHCHTFGGELTWRTEAAANLTRDAGQTGSKRIGARVTQYRAANQPLIIGAA